MPTDVTSTIGSSGRDYSTLQAWEDACPSNLVTDDKRWIGNCYNDSEFTGSGNLLTVSGITTDSTRYLYLKCATGQSFSDNAGVRSNALDYNASNGVAIRTTASNYTELITATSSKITLEGLQLKGGGTGGALFLINGGGDLLATKCIFSTGGDGLRNSGTFRNCLIIGCTNGTRPVGQINCYGCTFVNCTTGHYRYAYTTTVLYNTATFGHGTTFSGSSSMTGTDYVATDNSSVPVGANNQVSLTYADQFESTTNDFRAKSTGDLQAGTPDSTNTPDDITGLTRDATTPWIGCWEVAGGGGGTVRPRSLLTLGCGC